MEPDSNNTETKEPEDDYLSKVPARYQDLYDSDNFEKFTYRKGWED